MDGDTSRTLYRHGYAAGRDAGLQIQACAMCQFDQHA
jgi:hypothetical protein